MNRRSILSSFATATVLALAAMLAGCAPRAQTSRAGWSGPQPLAPAAAAATETAVPAETPPRPPVPAWITLFSGVRVNKAARQIEFDAIVPIDCHNPETPLVYLELVCCTPDTREHESLLMTRVLPSHIHAALLAAGLQSGKPGLVDFRGEKIVGRPPEGDGLQIELHYRDVRPDMPTSAAARAALPEVTATPAEWIVSNRGKPFEALPEGPGVWGPRGGWVFAGSRFVKRRDPETGVAREVYDADGAGQIIGLTTFGSEDHRLAPDPQPRVVDHRAPLVGAPRARPHRRHAGRGPHRPGIDQARTQSR